MSPDGIQNASTPMLDELMKTGAWSLNAKAVLPTSSSPNWASMIMGAPPKLHGIKSNSWEPKKIKNKRFCAGPKGQIWPTIFKVIRDQIPEANTTCFHDWGGFGRLIEPGVLTKLKNTKGPAKTISSAIGYFEENQPLFTFIHLDHVDHAGHKHGHGTQKYYKAVEEADRFISQLVSAMAESGKMEETIILITADHGGKGKGHGGKSPEEVNIPWIISGPGIKEGFQIENWIDTYDTAPTLAYLLGLNAPKCWTGKPVVEALQND